LKLLAFTESSVRVIPFQLSLQNGDKKFRFAADLPKGAHRLFRFVSDFDAKEIPVAEMKFSCAPNHVERA